MYIFNTFILPESNFSFIQYHMQTNFLNKCFDSLVCNILEFTIVGDLFFKNNFLRLWGHF